ncbi:hypothetical protein R1sor_008023 [Riccia sorocarpa]|uniref:Uncharacterized protein n=1 Tax=Riccia sorocarpa TaxID=122646 RepID=A0ABD3HV17_9MARC
MEALPYLSSDGHGSGPCDADVILESAVKPILSQLEVEESEVDALCREVDSSIANAKKVFEAAVARGWDGFQSAGQPSDITTDSIYRLASCR